MKIIFYKSNLLNEKTLLSESESDITKCDP